MCARLTRPETREKVQKGSTRRARPRRPWQELERRNGAQRVPGFAARALPEKRGAVETAVAAPVTRVSLDDVAQRRSHGPQLLLGRFDANRQECACDVAKIAVGTQPFAHTVNHGGILVIAAQDGGVGDLRAARAARCSELVENAAQPLCSAR